MYTFTIKKANEISLDNNLAKDEAKVMMEAFKTQGNEKHGIEMSHIYGQSTIVDRMFNLVKIEYLKLKS